MSDQGDIILFSIISSCSDKSGGEHEFWKNKCSPNIVETLQMLGKICQCLTWN